MRIVQHIATAALFSLTLGALMPSVALADCDKAERFRLEEELRKLAGRNAWAGVERTYSGLEKLKCEMPFEDYFLGGQSARYLGKTYEMFDRLSKAKDLDAGDREADKQEIINSLSGIEGIYGRVAIKGNERRPPALTRAAMPFAPDQRKSIEWAQTVISNTGKFSGMLPAGDYDVGGVAFSVTAGQQFEDEGSEIIVGKVKGGGGGGGGDKGASDGGSGGGPGLVMYSGPIMVMGVNFLSSGEPATFNYPDTSVNQFAPDKVFGGGAMLTAGYELGFTKEFGVAGTFGYDGAYGTDTFHGVQGWLAGTFRPGDLRIAAGPTYNLLRGAGTGVASWFDVGQDKDRYPNAVIQYKGWSWGGGARMSVGYGFVDFERESGGKFQGMQGVVELGASWRSDGYRSFLTFGLQVGVVPLIKRFKG